MTASVPIERKMKARLGSAIRPSIPLRGPSLSALNRGASSRKCHAQRFDGQAVDLQQ